MASMTTSAFATPSTFDVGGQPRQRLARASPHRVALLEELARALQRRRDVLLAAILQRHGETARCAPGRDVAAHHAGAHDVHVLRGLARRPCRQGFQAVLQEEHAHQVARGRRAQQLAPSSALRLRKRACPCRRSAARARSSRRAQGSARAARRAPLASASGRRASARTGPRFSRRSSNGARAGGRAERRSCFAVASQLRRPARADRRGPSRERLLRPDRADRSASGPSQRATPTSCTARTVPPNPGCMPSCTSGKPSVARRIVDQHAIATGEGSFETAAERKAVDGGDRRAGQSREPVEHLLAGADQLVRLLGRAIPMNSLMSAPAMKPSFSPT